MSASSLSDSQLKLWMPDTSAYSTSSAVLPTPEKTTFAGSPPALQHAIQLAARDDVEARSLPGQQRQHRQRRIGLHRVAYVVRQVAERGVVRAARCQNGGVE